VPPIGSARAIRTTSSSRWPRRDRQRGDARRTAAPLAAVPTRRGGEGDDVVVALGRGRHHAIAALATRGAR
jgi:hypothetical protein